MDGMIDQCGKFGEGHNEVVNGWVQGSVDAWMHGRLNARMHELTAK